MKKIIFGAIAAIFATFALTAPSFATQIQPRGVVKADGDYGSYGAYDSTYGYEEEAAGDILGALAGIYLVAMVVSLAVSVFAVVCMWKIFTKAGQEGWKSIIPIYNMVIMCKIAGVSPWLILAFMVPLVNFGVMIYLYYKFVTAFGKGVGFLIGLLFFAPIFMAILAFDKNVVYVGQAPVPTPGAVPGAAPAVTPMAPADPWVTGQAVATPATPAAPAAPTAIPPLESQPAAQPGEFNPFNQQPGQPTPPQA